MGVFVFGEPYTLVREEGKPEEADVLKAPFLGTNPHVACLGEGSLGTESPST